MFTISVGSWSIRSQLGSLPALYAEYRRHSLLAEEFDLQNPQRALCFLAVSRSAGWPELVVVQTFAPSVAGFDPGVLLVPETETLFIGAGVRLLAYRLHPLQRLWEDECDTGFWHWQQHGNYVLMSAELELAAWDCFGKKLWSTFVEPPWDYGVEGDRVRLNVMGRKSEFDLATGPENS